MKELENLYQEISDDEYFIKREKEFYEDQHKKSILREIEKLIFEMMNMKCSNKEDENNYYNEMEIKSLKKMQNTISEMKEMINWKYMNKTSSYSVEDSLVKKGYLYDNFHLYVPFTYKDDKNPNPKIYLAIAVWARYNWADGDYPVVFYCWCQPKGNKFEILSDDFVGPFPIDENYDFINDLYQYGDECGLNYNKDQYSEFAKRLKEDILSSPSLDYLKNVDTWRGRSTSQELNLGLGPFIEIN